MRCFWGKHSSDQIRNQHSRKHSRGPSKPVVEHSMIILSDSGFSQPNTMLGQVPKSHQRREPRWSLGRGLYLNPMTAEWFSGRPSLFVLSSQFTVHWFWSGVCQVYLPVGRFLDHNKSMWSASTNLISLPLRRRGIKAFISHTPTSI